MLYIDIMQSDKKYSILLRNSGLLIFVFIGIFAKSNNSYAQKISVGSVQEESYRRMQLLGEVPMSSFSVRPIVLTDSLRENSILGSFSKTISTFDNGKGVISLLPISWKNQFNSHHSYGWNDGAMIPSKGYQTFATAGVNAKLGPLNIKLQPEYVFATNDDFGGFREGKSDAELAQYITFMRSIDAPERFGDKSFSAAYWGQSSISLNFDPISFGLSTENLWWGPGIYNSLLMSNNAPGFMHLTFNTTRPFNTPIGAFEMQLIGGRLKQSGYKTLMNTNNSNGVDLFVPKKSDNRYLSGLNISYQPKWLKGLTFGFIRTFMSYESELHGIGDYLPLFVKLQKETGDQDNYPRDQRISLNARWLFSKANAEVYFEYGLNDNAYNFRDFFGSPDHGRAYLFGFNKLIPIKSHKEEYLQLSAEVTQLSQSIDRTVRNAGGFYNHSGVNQGYTHKGQVLGAGIGTGGNLQIAQLKWVKDLKNLGIQFERYEHSVDFEQRYYSAFGSNRRWVDFAFSLNGQWDYRNFIFNATLKGVQSLNYQWLMKDFEPSQNYVPHNDVFNVHSQIGLTYRF